MYTSTKILAVLALTACSSIAGQAAAADSIHHFSPVNSIEMKNSKGKFDFLRIDVKRHRLLAAHENDATFDVIDLQEHTLISRLKLGGAVDTAIDLDSKYYYVSVQEAQRVAFVDAGTLKEVRSVKTPGPTDAIIFEPNNRLIYVTHDEGADVWVIDPATAAIVQTIAIPGVPEFMVYDSTTDRIYVNIKTKDVVAVIDPKLNKVVAQWPTAPASQPHGLAADPAQHRIFAAGGNGKLVAIDTESGHVTSSIDIVPKVDQIAFDPTSNLVFCAGADQLSVVATGGNRLTPAGQIATAATAKNVAVDAATREIWTTYTEGGASFAKSWVER